MHRHVEKNTQNIERIPVRDYLEYGLFYVLRAGIRLLTVDRASAFMGRLWAFIGPMTSRQGRVEANLKRALPHLQPEDRRRIARHMWNNLGRTAAESLLIDKIDSDPGRITHNTADLINRLRDDGVGAVMVSLHTGNWELMSYPFAQGGLACSGVYQRLRNRLVDQEVQAARAKFYPGGLFRKTASSARQLLKLVADGGHLGLLTDHREERGAKIEFFGATAMTSTFPAALARRLQVPLLAGRVIRRNGAYFYIETAEIPVPHTDDMRADIHKATQNIHTQFEHWIRQYPEQWMWIQRRWLTPIAKNAGTEAPVQMSRQSDPDESALKGASSETRSISSKACV